MPEEQNDIIDYIQQEHELDIAVACHRLKLPLMLRGPSGIGKTTMVYSLGRILNLPLVIEPCNEDTVALDLVGRLTKDGWMPGSATIALDYEEGAVYYLDELGKARPNAMTVAHQLTDDQRRLKVLDETKKAPEKFTFIAAYNAGAGFKTSVDLALAQRFITVDVPYPEPGLERRITDSYLQGAGVVREEYKEPDYKKISRGDIPIDELIKVANEYRNLASAGNMFGLKQGPGTRLVGRTAKLVEYGIPIKVAIEIGMINPLTHNKETKQEMIEVAGKVFRF